MNIFNIFRRKNKNNSEANYPKIEFGFRGEGINYSLRDKEAWIDFTYINGHRIYSESINKWNNGSAMTDKEKELVFCDVLLLVSAKRGEPIIVINSDDSSKKLWEILCSENKTRIESVEYTSNEENYQVERNMYLDFLKAGNKVIINGIEISKEEDVDKILLKKRLSDKRRF